MTMILPDLDNVTWEQLNEEARSLIPAYAPQWTNFNPSDPGITLLELLAYFTEMLLYRANRIGDEQTLRFLRLLNGPAWNPKPTASLEDERRRSLLALMTPLRAVTAADFEMLAMSAVNSKLSQTHSFRTAGSQGFRRIARAKCLTDRNLAPADLALRDSPAPGHVSVIVVPGLSGLSGQGTAPSSSELNAIRQALDAARPITTRVHVVGPTYIPFGVRLTLVKTRQASADLVNTAAINQLADFFDPLRGGHDEKGWPFGRSVYVSEVYQLLGKIPGVDYVTRSLDANGEDMEELFVDPLYSDRRCLNDAGELESIEVHDEELVALKIDPADVIVLEKASRRL